MRMTNYKCKWKKYLLLFLPCMLLAIHPMAQTTARKITGKIVNETNGDPVTNATVTVKGTKTIVMSDANGSFSIDAEKGNTLLITSTGFESKEVKISSTSSLEIRMEEKFHKLDDVVVIGYGKMKKTDLSSSQVSIGAKEIQRTVNTTVEQALQGRAANVYVTSNSGQPGAAPSVVIRGLSSINYSSQPLYVIDGVQFKPENPGGGSGISSNMLATINPDDIETINVLQGPSATAIYGATGANGVVMITTKRGKKGDTKVSVNSLTTVNDFPPAVEVMNLQEYATFRNEVAKLGGAPYDPAFSDPKALGEGTNWQKALFRRTLLQKYSLSLSGGTDKTTFYLGAEYFNQEGALKGSGFKRYSLRLNLDNQANKWLKIGTSLNIGSTNEVVNISNDNLLNTAISQNPSIPVTNPDGSWGGPVTTQYQYSNPIALSQINDNRNKTLGLNGSLYAAITLPRGFSLYNELNSYYQFSNSYRFNPSYKFGGYENTTTTSYRSSGNNYWWGLNTRLQYDKSFGKHTVNSMLGHEASENGYEGLYGSRQRFVSNNIQELQGGDIATATNGSSKSSGAKESYFARVNYNFNSKYFVQGTVRADGSSNFGEEKRWGYFPAVSAAWRISGENFFQKIKFVNDLKLRLEWGISGNSAAAGYYATLMSVPTGWGTGFVSSNFNNPSLQWEQDKSYNVGLDLYMFNNRIEIIADAYVKNIDKLLTRNDYPYYSGGDISYSPGYIQFPTENAGSMQNKGFGITINTVNTKKVITWKTGLNFSIDKNKITGLRNSTPINSIYGNSSLITSTRVGEAAALFTGYIAEGLFQNITEIQNHAIQTSNRILTINPDQGTWVGDVKFKDVNGDGFIDQNDRVVIGNPWPKFSFGFNNSITWKNFDLNIFINGVQGNDIFNYTRFKNEGPGGSGPYSNYLKSVANFARPSSTTAGDMTTTLTNPGYKIPRISPADANGNTRASNWYVEDGSYIRLKNISLAYNVPLRIASKASMKSLKVSINVQNLFTLTKYTGYDPEIGMSPGSGSLSVGLDDVRYPSVRMYSFSLTAAF
jgi:TonB-dependent starch-binding outer membrane protein SusC